MADAIREYLDIINSIPGLSVVIRSSKWYLQIRFQSDNPKLHIKEITVVQAHLRQIKKNVGINIKQARAAFTQASANQTYKPGLGGMLFGASYRGARQRGAAEARRNLTVKNEEFLQPYTYINNLVGELIDQLAAMKLQKSIDSQ